MPPTSFTSFLPGSYSRPPSTTTLDRSNTSHKRPAQTYNDSDAAKRHHSSLTNNDSLFVSDDETDAQLDDDLFGNDNDNDDIAFLGRFDSAISTRPVQGAAQGRPSLTRPATQLSFSANSPSHTTRERRPTNASTTSSGNFRPNNINGNSNTSFPPRVTANPRPQKSTIEIKDEPDTISEPDWTRDLPSTEKVKIFIGKKNRQIWVKRVDLHKSPILTSWITDDAEQGAYIMRPQLMKADFNDFDAVLQYVHSGEYAPLLVETEGGVDGQTPKNVLDGLQGAGAYARELIRSGRLYILANTFQVEGLAELVFRKISKVDDALFSLRSIVELAGVVFSERESTSVVGVVTSTPTSPARVGVSPNSTAQPRTRPAIGDGVDPLETWIITRVAKNFQEIMTSQQVVFWKVERKTRKKLFFAKVLEEVAEQYRATGGKLPEPVVELD